MQGWPRLPALGGVLTVQLEPCYAPVFGCRCRAMAHLPSWGASGCSWGFVYKPAGHPLHVQNGDYKGKSLFQMFSAVLGTSHLETGSPRQQLCLLVALVFCPHLLSSSRRKCQNAWNQWLFGRVPACRFAANVQHDVPNCSGVALVSSLQVGVFDCLACAAPSSWASQWGKSAQRYAGTGGRQRGLSTCGPTHAAQTHLRVSSKLKLKKNLRN